VTLRALLVEDEAIVAMAVGYLLESLGVTLVGVADNGPDAIKLTLTSHPDFVVMDIRLKGEMSGIDAAKTIRAESAVPIIFTTAYSPEEIRREHQVDDSFLFASKPLRREALVAAISQACGEG